MTLRASLYATLVAPWYTFADRVRVGPWAPSEAHLAFVTSALHTIAVLVVVAVTLTAYGWPTTIAAVVLLSATFATVLGAVDVANRRDRRDGRVRR